MVLRRKFQMPLTDLQEARRRIAELEAALEASNRDYQELLADFRSAAQWTRQLPPDGEE